MLTRPIVLTVSTEKLRWIPMPESPPERSEPALRATVLKSGPKPGEYFGAYEVGGVPLARFAMPKVGKAVDWSDLQPAIEVRGSTAYVSHGLWGDRHDWLEAMREHTAILGVSVEGLDEAIDEMRRIEALDFDAVRREILEVASITPKNVDWREEVALEALVSFDRAMEYWTSVEEAECLRFTRSAGPARKRYWDPLVGLLTRRPETPAVIQELLGYLADINWPGAGRAWKHLSSAVGRRALPHIEILVRVADEVWAENLRELAKEILG